jgi:23S rRNA (uracil1939-C5)-methyltransferase
MAFGGRGVCKTDGKVYFVDGAIEGDVCDIEVTSDHKRYGDAVVKDMITPSPLRGQSICDVSTVCGGCQWQGIPYEKQLEWKTNFVKTSLQRIGKLSSDTIEIIASPTPYSYRNRILLRSRIQADGNMQVGYFKRATRDFIAISDCAIADEHLRLFIKTLRSERWPNKTGAEVKLRFEVQTIPLAPIDQPHILVTLYDPEPQNYDIGSFKQAMMKLAEVCDVKTLKELPLAENTVWEEDPTTGHTFFTSPGLFQQVNVPLNHKLRQLVLEEIKKYKPDSVLDVFCGSGNLSIPMAAFVPTIVGIEYSKRAIVCAQRNCIENDISNADYISGDAKGLLSKFAKEGRIFDLVIADPPREGMYDCITSLKKIAPEKIIYISCDPSTLARDLSSLCQDNYVMEKVIALDFFPNTYHVETFVVLRKEFRSGS